MADNQQETPDADDDPRIVCVLCGYEQRHHNNDGSAHLMGSEEPCTFAATYEDAVSVLSAYAREVERDRDEQDAARAYAVNLAEQAYRTIGILSAYVAVLVRRNGGALDITMTELNAAQGCAVQSSVDADAGVVTLVAPRMADASGESSAIEVVTNTILTPEKIRMLNARRRMIDG